MAYYIGIPIIMEWLSSKRTVVVGTLRNVHGIKKRRLTVTPTQLVSMHIYYNFQLIGRHQTKRAEFILYGTFGSINRVLKCAKRIKKGLMYNRC